MRARFCLLYLVVIPTILALTPAALAQDLEFTIPNKQAHLSKTFAPTTEEQSPSGTGKFVIFTREEVGKEGQRDCIAGAWECIPSRPEVPLTKRVEFCHSSWAAGPLLDCLVRDNSEDLYPRFVTLMVKAGNQDYTVNLYDINYRTWEVRCIWQGNQLSAFGVMKEKVFMREMIFWKNWVKEGKWFCLDAFTGAIRNEVPFVPLDVDGAYWLVRKHGETSGSWSYDPAKEEYIGHFDEVEDSHNRGHTRSLLSPDGRSRAWILVPLPDEWRGGIIHGTMLLLRTGQSKDIRLPISMQARVGSGVPILPVGTSLQFTADGKVEFSSSADKAGTKDRVWSIEIASGKTMESIRPHPSRAEPGFATFDGVPAPDYLRPYLKDLTHFGRRGLAPAFLKHLGVLKKLPEFPDCETGVSRDGRHILYKAKKGSLANFFIYGDLQTKQTLRWKSPAGIRTTDSMEFVWVETP